jgi:hypothetical protein
MPPKARSRPAGRLIASAAVTALVALSAPAAASALTNFAAPTNQGTHDCLSAQDACELATALTGSPSEVVLADGEYGTEAAPLAAFKVSTPTDIHGPSSGPLPRIFIGTSGISLDNTGATLQRTEVDQGSGAYFGVEVFGASMEQDIVNGSSPCVGYSGSIRNSLCHSTYTGSSGALYANGSIGSPSTLTLRNDTLIGSAGSNAVFIDLSGGSPVAFDFTNVIARGPGGAVPDINAQASGTTATLALNHSSYGTVSDAGGATTTAPGTSTNQTSAPLLSGEYKELEGSPTIDAGITEAANGPYDLEGSLRTYPIYPCGAPEPPPAMLSYTDIGAYEYQPPPPPCAPLNHQPIQSVTVPPLQPVNTIPGTKITRALSRRRKANWKFIFRFEATEGSASGFECELLGGRRRYPKKHKAAFSPCTSPTSYKHVVGQYEFEVRAFSTAGVDRTPATAKVSTIEY